MGNSFSSRWQFHSRRLTVEECLQLDVNKIKQQGRIQLGTKTIVQNKQTISITWSGCNYGSQRPWFECPKCKRRAGKLYAHFRGYYLCRKCLNLGYKSKLISGDGFDVAIARIERFKRKLKAPRDLLAPIHSALLLPKPKGMHWKTYERLVQQCWEAENKMYKNLNDWLLGRYQDETENI